MSYFYGRLVGRWLGWIVGCILSLLHLRPDSGLRKNALNALILLNDFALFFFGWNLFSFAIKV